VGLRAGTDVGAKRNILSLSGIQSLPSRRQLFWLIFGIIKVFETSGIIHVLNMNLRITNNCLYEIKDWCDIRLHYSVVSTANAMCHRKRYGK
jgi:hypothetical protein